MRKHTLLPITLLIVLSFAFSQARSASGNGQKRIFELGLSARSVALGGALTSLTDDASSALSNNPAALTTLARGQITLFHAPLFEGSRYDAFTFALPSLDHGALGLSAVLVTAPDIDLRDINNFNIGTMKYSEQQFSLAYALPLISKFALGIQGLFTQQKMGSLIASSYSANMGLHATHKISKDSALLLGLTAKDWIETGLQLGTEKDKPAPSVSFGLGLKQDIGNTTLLLLAEPRWVRDNGVQFKGGLELAFAHAVALRSGWNGDQISVGAGLGWRSVNLDYALSMQDSLGLTHRASLRWVFGPDVVVAAQNRKSREERMKAEILEKLKRDSIKGYLSAGDSFVSDNKFEEARQEFSKILAWDSANPEALSRIENTRSIEKNYVVTSQLAEGKRLFTAGEYLDAMVKFKAVLDADPKNLTAQNGMKSSEQKVRTESKKAFLSVTSLPPAEAQKYFEEGLSLYMSGQYTQALNKWKVIIAANPINRQIFEYVSRAQVKLEADKVMSERKKEQEVKQSQVQILQKQAIQNYQKGDLKGAIDSWKEVLKADPQNAEAQAQLQKSEKELLDSRKRGVRW